LKIDFNSYKVQIYHSNFLSNKYYIYDVIKELKHITLNDGFHSHLYSNKQKFKMILHLKNNMTILLTNLNKIKLY
jgi:hypothetical protein